MKMNYQNDVNKIDPMRAVKPYLQEGEEVLWTGRPYKSVPFRSSPVGKFFALFWLGFSLFWTISVVSMGGGFMGIAGMVFVAIGVYLLYSVTVGEKKQYTLTAYAVTTKRAIIVTRGKQGVNCHEYPLAGLDNISLENVIEDTGTIRLVPQQIYYDRKGRRREANSDITSVFIMIDDVHKVYRILLDNRK